MRRQKNMFQIKEQDKALRKKKKTNEMQMNNLSDKEFQKQS